MKSWIPTVSLLLLTTILAGNVVELNDTTFKQFLVDHPVAIIDFYATWCSHCKTFAPIFENISEISKERKYPFAFAKIDANINTKAKIKFDVTTFPSVKVIINNTIVTYKKDLDIEVLLDYAMWKYKLKVIQLKTKQEIAKVKQAKDIRNVLVSDNPEVLREFKEAAMETDIQSYFYYTSEALGKAMFPEIKTVPSVIILRDYPEGNVVYEPIFGKYRFRKFLHEHDIPIIARMTPDVAETFISPGDWEKIGIILYRDDTKKELDKEFVKLRRLIPSREFAFVLSDLKTDSERQVAQYLGIQREDFPTLIIVKPENRLLNRYMYRGQLEKNKMFAFFNDWKAGKIPKTLKSEPEPERAANTKLYSVVGKTFKREVIDNDVDTMIMFYSPTCPHCIKLKPIYFELSKKYTKIKWCVIDATANEVEGVFIDGYPTVFLYPAGKKDAPLKTEDNSEEYLIKFIKEHSTFPIEDPKPEEPASKPEEKKPEEKKTEEKPKESAEKPIVKEEKPIVKEEKPIVNEEMPIVKDEKITKTEL